MTDRPDLEWIPLDSIEFDAENPNKEDMGTFNALVDAIKEHGYAAVEPITVVPLGEGKYRLVAGEHRTKAVRLAGAGDVMPAMIVSKAQWDDDQRQIALVRSNVIQGRLDPTKFTALWRRLEARYGPDSLSRMMGFGSKEAELRRLVKQTGDSLPGRMQAEFAESTKRIRSVEDLAAVVNDLFTRHGSTLPESYIAFAFGGRTHLMIRCTPETFGPIKEFVERQQGAGVKVDEALAAAVGAKEAV